MIRNKSFIGLYILASFFVASQIMGCKASNTQKGAAIGVGAGGAVGGIIGNKSGNTAAGAIIGAAVGGAAGALIGRQMDKQAEEMREDLEGAEVERVGEGIKLTFDSGFLFAFDSDELNDSTKQNLDELARILKKYDDTDIIVEGHTDSKGTKKYNQQLSEERSQRVRNYLAIKGVDTDRMESLGRGEDNPIADNTTETGRAQNRRVEIAIFANEEMKKAAENEQL